MLTVKIKSLDSKGASADQAAAQISYPTGNMVVEVDGWRALLFAELL